MKIVVFQAGLGNQIFQYVYYLYLRKEYPQECFYGFYPSKALKRHNGLEINRWFDVELPIATKRTDCIANILCWIGRLCFKLRVPPPFIDNDWYRKPNATLYYGFWQDKKYMQAVRLPKFKQTLDIGKKNLSILQKMRATNSVAVHVRRGDYTDPKNQYIYGNIGTLAFYHKALNIIKERVLTPSFFFFFISVIIKFASSKTVAAL